MDKFKFTADIAQKSSYIIEIKANNLNDANKIIFSLNKKTNNKYLKFKRLDFNTGIINKGDNKISNIIFSGVKYFNEESNSYKTFPIEKIKTKQKENKEIIFVYSINFIEYNRFEIEVESKNIDIARNLILINKSSNNDNYKANLIQISSREYFEGNNIIMILN